MTSKQMFVAAAVLSASYLVMAARRACAETAQHVVTRLAELEIDPTQLDSYKAALKKEIAVSIKLEPGVLKLYALSVKDHPNQIRMFEMYRDQGRTKLICKRLISRGTRRQRREW